MTSLSLVIFALLVLVGVYLFNVLTGLRNRCDRARQDIDAHLRRRYDLVPNLVETVKGYARHERETLEAVVRARSEALNASGASRPGTEARFVQSLWQVVAVAEQYPELKANSNFLELQTELSKIEEMLLGSREGFNRAVEEYNRALQTVPYSAIAGLFGFRPYDYYALAPEDRDLISRSPEVRF